MMDYREEERAVILEVLQEAKLTAEQCQGVMIDLESAIYNEACRRHSSKKIHRTDQSIEFKEIYSSIGYNMIHNLDGRIAGSDKLLQKIVKMWILKKHTLPKIYEAVFKYNKWDDLSDMVKLTPTEINPEPNNQITAMIETRKKTKIKPKYSRLYTCGKCKSDITLYYNDQKRCGDEGYTMTIICVGCRNQWSMKS